MNRSMDNLEMLTDSELRHRLMQYGFPNLPVTDTTRKTLIKKLRNYMNNEKSKLRRETVNATRYSSDEDTYDSDSIRKKERSLPTSSTISGRTSSPFKSSNNSMPPPASTIVTRRFVTTANASNRLLSTENHLPEIPRASSSAFTRGSTKSTIYLPPPIIATDSDEDAIYNFYPDKNSSSISSRLSLTPSPSVYENTADVNDSWMRNRYSKNTSATGTPFSSSVPLAKFGDSISTSSEETSNGHHSVEDSPYLSDFTRRLLNLRGETIRDTKYNNKPLQPPVKRIRYSDNNLSHILPPSRLTNPNTKRAIFRSCADIVHQQSEPNSELNISPSEAFSNFISKLDEQYGFKQTLIPCILLSALFFFFVIVAFMYMTISPDLANTVSDKNTIYTICPMDIHTQSAIATAGYSCIEKDSIKDALELLRFMALELQKRAVYNRCKDSSAPYMMNTKEILRYMLEMEPSKNVRKIMKDLYNVEYLIERNPNWKINPVDATGNELTFNQVIQEREKQSTNFAILNPRLPFTCSVYNKLQQFFLYVGGVGILILLVCGLYLIYRLLTNYRQSKKDSVTQLTDDIINTLMKKAACDPDQNAVVVNHLRDKIIPLLRRKKLEWAWNEAIKYLELNDSRIQFELGIRNGEDCKLMRWIDTVSPEQIGIRSNIKKWQSPAFDKTNKITCPPTPCLKIRQMFDKYEANNPSLKTVIQDAILEKVGRECKIYDIQLDKASCCVYVRCASPMDAGIVHDEINGWWFDKRLVSIKFLRLERYLSRFPKSSGGPNFLHPSNTKNLSMSQCYMDDGPVNGLPDDDDDDD